MTTDLERRAAHVASSLGGVAPPMEITELTQSSIKLTSQDLEPFRQHRLRSRRYLPFLKTLADFDITSEIGFHELSGCPLTVKQLLLLDIAPPVTVFRRLNRLCDLGIIVRTHAPRDRRVHELRLAPAVHRLFAIYTHPDDA